MSMELIICHVTNRLAFLADTYFLGIFLKLSLKMQSGTGIKTTLFKKNYIQ